jgi:hypothetical protein
VGIPRKLGFFIFTQTILFSKENPMHLLSFFIETVSASIPFIASSAVATIFFAAFGVFRFSTLNNKLRRKVKVQAAKEFLNSKFTRKREKGSGAVIFLVILLLLAGVAVLWVLWELGGIFALILGIVGVLGMISIFMRMK